MSDLGRKSFTDKASEKLTPDSQKSGLEKAKESVTGGIDKAAAAITPDDQKSASQSVGDKIQKGSDKADSQVQKDKKGFSDTANDFFKKGEKAVGDAAQYLSGVVKGGKKGGEAASK